MFTFGSSANSCIEFVGLTNSQLPYLRPLTKVVAQEWLYGRGNGIMPKGNCLSVQSKAGLEVTFGKYTCTAKREMCTYYYAGSYIRVNSIFK